MMWHGNWSIADWVFVSVCMLLFWSLVVVAALWWLDRSRAAAASHARAILDERLSRGDLSAEEYQTRRDLLSQR